jgi:predicted ATPase/two-component sensor histidine kinase
MPPPAGAASGARRGSDGFMSGHVLNLQAFSLNELVADGHTVLWRGKAAVPPFGILLRGGGRAANTAEIWRYLDHELSLADLLEPDFALKPIQIARLEERDVLILSDPGADPLNVAQMPVDLPHFLSLAIGITDALVRVHRAGLTHNNLRPANILLNAGGKVWLTGFGEAVRRGPAFRATRPQILDAASLPYLPPERSGRVDQPVDGRSDLYSLGTTLYQMASGQLPFRGRDAVEWIQFHVGRQPAPLNARWGATPEPLAAIIMRLLRKNPGERYLSASDVLEELRSCRDVVAFKEPVLGLKHERKPPQSAHMPEFVHGREPQIEILLNEFRRVETSGRMGVMLIEAPAGTGKSALVRAFSKRLAAPVALFASGKFDQHKRDVPYLAVRQALDALLEDILPRDPVEVQYWRAAIDHALGPNARLLTNVLPHLRQLIGDQPRLPDLPPHEAQTRFDVALSNLLGVLATPARPLVLFLDDLQWADDTTIGLLSRLVAQGGIRHLMLVGAYRPVARGERNPLDDLQGALLSGQRDVQSAVLPMLPLDRRDVDDLVAEMLSCEPRDVRELAAVVYARAGGNPFFATQVVSSLIEAGIISFDSHLWTWRWDQLSSLAADAEEDVIELLAGRLRGLPGPTRDVAMRLACLGSSASSALLSCACGVTPADINAAMSPLLEAGLALRQSGGFCFLHDRVLEGAYALIPEHQRESLHLDIGRRLLQGGAGLAAGEATFDAANQFARCKSLVLEHEERQQVAALFLKAGRRAKAANAQPTARTFFRQGADLLDEARWDSSHELAFALHYEEAECAFLAGELDTASRRLRLLEAHTGSLAEKAAVAWLQITLLTATDQSLLAIQACLGFLRASGISWSASPSREEVLHEYRELESLIAVIGPDGLLDVPKADNAEHQAVLEVLAATLPPAFFSDENMVCLVLCRMVKLSLQNGLCDASPLAFAYLGMMAGPYFSDYAAGYRFGRLGLDLVRHRGLDRYKPRVSMVFAYHVSPWNEDVRTQRSLLLQAFEDARQGGDVTYAGFSSVTLITSMLFAGDPLEEVQRAAESRLSYVRRARFGLCADILTSQIQLVRALRGLSSALDTLQSRDFDESAFERRLKSNASLDIARCWHWIRKMQLMVIAGDYAPAADAAAAAAPLLWTSSGHIELAEFHFYAALARSARRSVGTASDAEILAIERHLAVLANWAEHSPNFRARKTLVEAELLRLRGHREEAIGAYDAAVRLAGTDGSPLVRGLASELGAHFYAALGLTTLCTGYMRDALASFEDWGATAKVAQILRTWPQFEDKTRALAQQSVGEGIELGALIDTSNVLARSADTAGLLVALVKIMLEQSAATRAVLIVPRGDTLEIEAEANLSSTGVTASAGGNFSADGRTPLSVLKACIRDMEAIVLNEVGGHQPFGDDPFLKVSDVLSLMCMPLIYQGKPVGLVYLENSVTSHAFPLDRLQLIKLLGSQAAMSIANAGLEEKEALLKEVHHRVKNNLQLITSLLNLQAGRIDSPEIANLFAESRDRVRSMALVHESLYRLGNFARVPMRAHLEALCSHLMRAYRPEGRAIDLHLAIEDVQLDLDRAVYCGLIINELVSNALKHAFHGSDHGLIQVSLTSINGRCKLGVRDNGAGLPESVDMDDAGTLGLQIVSDLTAQLHGTLVAVSDGGADFVVNFAGPDFIQ